MTRVSLSRLGPAARAQAEAILAAGGGKPVKAGSGKSRAGIGEAAPCPGRCRTGDCREPFPRFAGRGGWLSHVVTVHGGRGRWEIDL